MGSVDSCCELDWQPISPGLSIESSPDVSFAFSLLKLRLDPSPFQLGWVIESDSEPMCPSDLVVSRRSPSRSGRCHWS